MEEIAPIIDAWAEPTGPRRLCLAIAGTYDSIWIRSGPSDHEITGDAVFDEQFQVEAEDRVALAILTDENRRALRDVLRWRRLTVDLRFGPAEAKLDFQLVEEGRRVDPVRTRAELQRLAANLVRSAGDTSADALLDRVAASMVPGYRRAGLRVLLEMPSVSQTVLELAAREPRSEVQIIAAGRRGDEQALWDLSRQGEPRLRVLAAQTAIRVCDDDQRYERIARFSEDPQLVTAALHAALGTNDSALEQRLIDWTHRNHKILPSLLQAAEATGRSDLLCKLIDHPAAGDPLIELLGRVGDHTAIEPLRARLSVLKPGRSKLIRAAIEEIQARAGIDAGRLSVVDQTEGELSLTHEGALSPAEK